MKVKKQIIEFFYHSSHFNFQASSPTDSALDFMKRKRLNQIAAKQRQALGE